MGCVVWLLCPSSSVPPALLPLLPSAGATLAAGRCFEPAQFRPTLVLVQGDRPARRTSPALHVTGSFSAYRPHLRDQVPSAAVLGFHRHSSLSLFSITHPVYFLLDVITLYIILFIFFSVICLTPSSFSAGS